MRDPRAPIPSPTHDAGAGYWDRTSPPPRRPAAGPAHLARRADDYDPTRLLRPNQRDVHGIDRRGGPRRRGEVDSDPSHALVGATHRRLQAVLGLRTTQGWAIVRTLSLAPQGVLLHLLDLLDPELDAPQRLRGRQVLTALAPLMGAPDRPRARTHDTPRPRPSSPLATVGTCVLSRRVVADLAAWSNPTARATKAPVSSRRPTRRELTVSLVVPPPAGSQLRAGQPVAIVEGELVPLNDPNPKVLAVSLVPSRVRQLELLLGQRTRELK